MKRLRLFMVGCILVVAFALSGCIRIETDFVVHENNTVTLNVKYAFNKQKAIAGVKEMAAAMGGSLSTKEIEEVFAEYSEETINGEKYYVASESKTYTQKELNAAGYPVIVNKDKFYLYAASGMDDFGDLSTAEFEQEMRSLGLSLNDIEYIGCSVNLPSPVAKTNGVLQENQKTVVWELTTDSQAIELYAYTANVTVDLAADRQAVLETMKAVNSSSSKASGSSNKTNSKDTKAPVIKGIKKNKTYKKKVTVYVKDNKKLKKVTVNGKKVKLTKVKKGKYKGYFKFTVKKKGKNTIIAYDAAGNKKKISIKIK